jgi:hypothetical protein
VKGANNKRADDFQTDLHEEATFAGERVQLFIVALWSNIYSLNDGNLAVSDELGQVAKC